MANASNKLRVTEEEEKLMGLFKTIGDFQAPTFIKKCSKTWLCKNFKLILLENEDKSWGLCKWKIYVHSLKINIHTLSRREQQHITVRIVIKIFCSVPLWYSCRGFFWCCDDEIISMILLPKENIVLIRVNLLEIFRAPCFFV